MSRFSVRSGHAGVQRPGNGHALHDGRELFERRHIRASHIARAVHVPSDALPVHQLSGKFRVLRPSEFIRVFRRL